VAPESTPCTPAGDRADVVLVLTTLPIDADADAFAAALVEERLAACVSVLADMRSVYRWQDAVERAAERQVLVKTTKDRVPALTARVRTLHPYDVPELLVVDTCGGDESYLAWVRQCTGS
jgi:periplasmic divalent cation tolerance protein